MLTIASQLEVLGRFGKALADPTRARILLALLVAPSHPAQLARELGLTRTNVSNHLACLRGCGLVVAQPEGRRTRYEITHGRLAHALRDLAEVDLVVESAWPCPDRAADHRSGSIRALAAPVRRARSGASAAQGRGLSSPVSRP
jgi:DNA-binding transcriptional ArsR family regulator